MIPAIRFRAVTLNSGPTGKTRIVKDTRSGDAVMFSHYDINRHTQPPTATLRDHQGIAVATVPVRIEQRGCLVKYIADCLDPIGSQG